MINPFAEVQAAGAACLVPLLVSMFGALLLGTVIGSLAKKKTAPDETLRTELGRLRAKMVQAEDKLSVAGTVMNQRMRAQADEAAAAQLNLQRQLSAANAEIANLKIALVAAKRPIPVMPDAQNDRHAERLAQLEQEAARIPGLVQALDAACAQLSKATKATKTPLKGTTKPQALPEQVYRLMSTSFGKRIAPDDLQLVEGIGPKIAEHLGKHGLKTWKDVAAAKPAQLKKVLEVGGDRFSLHDPSHWPEQCKLMVENRWDELRKYQRKLSTAKS
ncbi:MAG TPA: helix-hairpin-helix domain-containing protein [Flavobacteriales bacterium]|nr:helix-hairpin-helix domain-containing protein [Flavobacteriales bacterium]